MQHNKTFLSFSRVFLPVDEETKSTTGYYYLSLKHTLTDFIFLEDKNPKIADGKIKLNSP